MVVYLSLGSNLGDRAAALTAALHALEGEVTITLREHSHCYETEPIGIKDQPPFLNMAVEIETDVAPLELLKTVKDIERQTGRNESTRWGPREIDIDIILWGNTVFESERLTLPHREFRQRAFVLAPMVEIAPDAIDPVTGATMAELAQSPDVEGWVEKREKLSP